VGPGGAEGVGDRGNVGYKRECGVEEIVWGGGGSVSPCGVKGVWGDGAV